MRKVRAGGIAIMAVIVGLALAGCGSDEKKAEATTSSSTSSSKAAPPSQEAAKPNATIADYIKQNGITETPVKRGDPGSPDIDLPFPPGWEDMGPETPAVGLGRNQVHRRPGDGRRPADDHRAAVEAARATSTRRRSSSSRRAR